MSISYEHNFHGVVTVRIGKNKQVPINTLNPDFYTRIIQLIDKDGKAVSIYLYGDNIEFDDNSDKAREIAIQLEE